MSRLGWSGLGKFGLEADREIGLLGEGGLERRFVDPTLTLLYQFARTQSLQSVAGLGPTLDIVRASSATYFDSDGILRTAGSGVARFDHEPASRSSLGLLVEEARTNLCLQSEDFETTWVSAGSNTTFTAAAGIAPDGTLSATDVLHNDVNEIIQQGITIVADTINTFSLFIHSGTTGIHDWVVLTYRETAVGNGLQAWFDLTNNGAVGTSQTFGAGATLIGTNTEDVGGGWFRISITGQLPSGITAASVRIQNADGDGSSNEEFTNSVFWWGADLEAGAFPTSYIQTVASPVTRNADSVSTSDVSWFNLLAGTMYCSTQWGHAFEVNNERLWTLSSGLPDDDDDTWNIFKGSGDNANLHYRSVDGTIRAALSITDGYETFNILVHTATAVALDDVEFYLNGVRSGTGDQSASPLMSAPDILRVGHYLSNNHYLNGHIAELRYYNVRKDNQFLEDLSSGRISA